MCCVCSRCYTSIGVVVALSSASSVVWSKAGCSLKLLTGCDYVKVVADSLGQWDIHGTASHSTTDWLLLRGGKRVAVGFLLAVIHG